MAIWPYRFSSFSPDTCSPTTTPISGNVLHSRNFCGHDWPESILSTFWHFFCNFLSGEQRQRFARWQCSLWSNPGRSGPPDCQAMELSCLDTLCRMVLLPLFPSASLGSCQSKEQNGGPMADMLAHPRSWWTSDFDWRKGVLAINSCSYAFAATSGILPGDVTGSVFPESFLFRLLSRDRHRFGGHTFAGS